MTSTPRSAPGAGPAGPRPHVGGDRAEEVLDALTALFLAEGFAHLGVAEMAARLHCSKSTLYAVAPSKEQIVAAAVRHFFRTATDRVEQRLAEAGPGREALAAYLAAIAEQLTPAGPDFVRDVEQHAPANEIYRRNTEAAAARVQELVARALPADSPTDPRFVGAAAAVLMESIQRGRLGEATGRDHAAAYEALSDLLVAATLS